MEWVDELKVPWIFLYPKLLTVRVSPVRDGERLELSTVGQGRVRRVRCDGWKTETLFRQTKYGVSWSGREGRGPLELEV